MDAHSRKGFTLIELLVVIAIIAILAAILFPLLTRAKDNAKRTNCVGNLRSIYQALNMYADDNTGHMPMGPSPHGPSNINGGFSEQDHGFASLWKYVKTEKSFCCPSARDWGTPGCDTREPRYLVDSPYYGASNVIKFHASYHFWPHLYSPSWSIAPRLDADLHDKTLLLYASIAAVKVQSCIDLGGPLCDDFLHNIDATSNKNGVLMLNMKGSVRFMAASAYPF